MQLFQKLGNEIEDLWRAENYNEAVLPAIAADALRRADIPAKASVWDVVEWALGQTELPRQRDVAGRFGDPPVTVYSGLRFHVDVYFWFEGTTSIHQHAFCGAFQVMHGSSIHSWYEFETDRVINTFTETGTMSLKVCELLAVGDVQEILAGRQYIHSLFHLDQPSATIVVRTDRSPLHLPQFNYLKPTLAIDPFFEQDTITKKTQLAGALLRAKHEDADRLIAGWFEKCDFQTTYGLLSMLRRYLRSGEIDKFFKLDDPETRYQEYLRIARERHGADIDVLVDVFERQDVVDEILRRRGFVTEPEHRFFMALLMNVDGKERIFELIKQRFPDADAVEKVLDWTFDLANTRVLGVENSNALGIQDFGDIDIFVLEQILRGKSGDEIDAAFRSEHGETVSNETLTISEREDRIRQAVIFRSLLA